MEVAIEPLWDWNLYLHLHQFHLKLGRNRTIMGLKRIIFIKSIFLQYVAIEPLWDWNVCKPDKDRRGRESRNRTIMGLKPCKLSNVLQTQHCRNRTIMGLKPLVFLRLDEVDYGVAIEPLWDWNFSHFFAVSSSHSSRNRTIMGLKQTWRRR